MTAPIEIRLFYPAFTVEHARAGVQPIKQPTGPQVNGHQPSDIFATPRLQYRVKTQVFDKGTKAYQWGPWIDVAMVREGYDDNEPGSEPGSASDVSQGDALG